MTITGMTIETEDRTKQPRRWWSLAFSMKSTSPSYSMYLECTCIGIGMKRWNRLMKGARPLNYDWLVRRIRKHMPDLYEALGLNYYNPYEELTRVTKTHYILVHSSIEYFIKK